MGVLDTFTIETKEPVAISYMYSPAELGRYESFVDAQFGEYTAFMHVAVDPEKQFEIIMIPPNGDADFYKFMTAGLGGFNMAGEGEPSDRAELCLYLPKDWPMDSADETFTWPIGVMIDIATRVLQGSLRIGYGSLVPSGDDAKPYSTLSDMCAMMLLRAVNPVLDKYMNLELSFDTLGDIRFYQLMPIYRTELEYASEHGVDDFLELMTDEELDPVFNVARRCCI